MTLSLVANQSATWHTNNSVITIRQNDARCGELNPMALSDIFPIFIAAVALWILVYCILMTQKIFMDSQYQEIQPKNRGEDEDAEEHAPHPPVSPAIHSPRVESDNRKHDHTERTFFAYYL